MLKMIAIGNLTGDPVLKTNEETGKPYAIAATSLRTARN